MISGVVVAMPGMLWCSAYHRRSKPRRSMARASSTAPTSAAALVLPLERGTRSRTDKGRGEGSMGGVAKGGCPGLRTCGPRRLGARGACYSAMVTTLVLTAELVEYMESGVSL